MPQIVTAKHPEGKTYGLIIPIGPPGCGKSELSKAIAKEHALPLIDIGKIIRKKIKNNELDEKTRRHVHAGGNLGPQVINPLVKEIMDMHLTNDPHTAGFVVCSPKTAEELLYFRQYAWHTFGSFPIVIDIILAGKKCRARIRERREKEGRPDDGGQEYLIRSRIFQREIGAMRQWNLDAPILHTMPGDNTRRGIAIATSHLIKNLSR